MKPIVSQYRQDNRDIAFLRLVNYAKAQGAAIRARERRSKKVTLQPPQTKKTTKVMHPSWKPRGSAHVVDSVIESSGPSDYSPEGSRLADVLVLEDATEEYSEEQSYGTTDPTESEMQDITPSQSETTEPVLTFRNGRAYTPVPRLPQEDRNTRVSRPGWVNQRQSRSGQKPALPPRRHGLICFSCYEKGHATPTCLLALKDLHKFITNYEALSPMERLGIPSTSYLKVKRYFEAQEGSSPSVSTTDRVPTTPLSVPDQVRVDWNRKPDRHPAEQGN